MREPSTTVDRESTEMPIVNRERTADVMKSHFSGRGTAPGMNAGMHRMNMSELKASMTRG